MCVTETGVREKKGLVLKRKMFLLRERRVIVVNSIQISESEKEYR